MARVPLAPRSTDLVPWAHKVTQRIERDYAQVQSEMASLSAGVQADLHSVSAVVKADIASVSAAIKADISSVSAAIKTDISSVSAAIAASFANRLPVAICNFTSTTGWAAPTVNKIYNVSTVSRSATGVFRINFASPVDITLGLTIIGNTDYGPVFLPAGASGTVSFSTDGCKIYTYGTDSVLHDVDFAAVVIYAKNP